MADYYAGPNNTGPLIGITAALCTVAVCLGGWRFAYRASNKVLGLSDLLLCVGMVSSTYSTLLCPSCFILPCSGYIMGLEVWSGH